jgi:hypothetical protein
MLAQVPQESEPELALEAEPAHQSEPEPSADPEAASEPTPTAEPNRAEDQGSRGLGRVVGTLFRRRA